MKTLKKSIPRPRDTHSDVRKDYRNHNQTI